MKAIDLYESGISPYLYEADYSIGALIITKSKYKIMVSPPSIDKGFYYFKIYDMNTYSLPYNMMKIARISFLSPEYIMIENNKNIDWFLSDIEKKELIDILNERYEYTNQTVWEYARDMFIYEGKGWGDIEYPKELYNCTIPDYTKLPNK